MARRKKSMKLLHKLLEYENIIVEMPLNPHCNMHYAFTFRHDIVTVLVATADVQKNPLPLSGITPWSSSLQSVTILTELP
jgi:hypothetical protein